MTTHTQKIVKTVNIIFNNCPTVIKREIIDHISVIEVCDEKVFIREGDECDGMFLIVKGGVKLFINRDGKKHFFLFKTINDLIGIQSVTGRTHFSYSAAAMGNSVLGFIPRLQVEKIISTYPHVFFSLFKKMNEKTEKLEQHSSLVMTGNGEKIVLSSIEDFKTRFGTDEEGYVNIRIKAKDLASYTCMSKTNLYRVLESLKGKKLLNHYLDRYSLTQ